MYELSIKLFFTAAHQLMQYKGAPEPLHGHNWDVEVIVRTETLNEDDLGMDFFDMKDVVGAVIQKFNHTNINDVPPFTERNTTSENMVHYLFHTLAPEFDRFRVTLYKVSLWDTPSSCASYFLTKEETK